MSKLIFLCLPIVIGAKTEGHVAQTRTMDGAPVVVDTRLTVWAVPAEQKDVLMAGLK